MVQYLYKFSSEIKFILELTRIRGTFFFPTRPWSWFYIVFFPVLHIIWGAMFHTFQTHHKPDLSLHLCNEPKFCFSPKTCLNRESINFYTMLQNPFIPLNNRILEFNVFLIIKLKLTIFLKKRKKKCWSPQWVCSSHQH